MKNISKRKQPTTKQLYNATFRVRELGYKVDTKNKLIYNGWSCGFNPDHESIQLLKQNFNYKLK
jgi:hypothetical protein